MKTTEELAIDEVKNRKDNPPPNFTYEDVGIVYNGIVAVETQLVNLQTQFNNVDSPVAMSQELGMLKTKANSNEGIIGDITNPLYHAYDVDRSPIGEE